MYGSWNSMINLIKCIVRGFFLKFFPFLVNFAWFFDLQTLLWKRELSKRQSRFVSDMSLSKILSTWVSWVFILLNLMKCGNPTLFIVFEKTMLDILCCFICPKAISPSKNPSRGLWFLLYVTYQKKRCRDSNWHPICHL